MRQLLHIIVAVLAGVSLSLAAIPLGLHQVVLSEPVPLLASLCVAALAASLTLLLLRRAYRLADGTSIDRQPLSPSQARVTPFGRAAAVVLLVLTLWILPWQVALNWRPNELASLILVAPSVLMAGVSGVAAATGRWSRARRAAP